MFLEAMGDRFGVLTDNPKFLAQMVHGVAVFAKGLFNSTMAQNEHSKGQLDQSFQTQVEKVTDSLRRLEERQLRSLTATVAAILRRDWLGQVS